MMGFYRILQTNLFKKQLHLKNLRKQLKLQVKARMDERQKRIDEALAVNVQIDDIKRYENAITYLDGIEEDVLVDESDESENLRKQIIYQDLYQ